MKIARIFAFPLILATLTSPTHALRYDITCSEDGSLEQYKLKGLNEAEAAIQNEALSENSLKSICENIYDCKAHLGFISDLTGSTIDILDKLADDSVAQAIKSKGEERTKNEARIGELNGKIRGLDEKSAEVTAKMQDIQSEIDKAQALKRNKEGELQLLNYQLEKLDQFLERIFKGKQIEELKSKIAEKEQEVQDEQKKIESLDHKKASVSIENEKLLSQREDVAMEIAEANNDQAAIGESIQEKVNELKEIYAECEGNKHSGALVRGNKISIYYPYNGRGNNKTSNDYDKPAIQKMIDMALLAGVDPYLTLAITMIENSPIRTGRGGWMENDSYANNYGAIPVDSIAAYDVMGCVSRESTTLRTPRAVKTLRVGGGTTKSRFCSSDTGVHVAAYPNLARASSASASGCCIDVIGSAAVTPMEVKSAIGIRFIKQIQNRIPDDQSKHADKGNYFALAYTAQRYNGLGVFGATEQMDNQCLIGINMAQRPAYGLLVQDLMANSLMANPAIKEMIESSKKKYKVSQSSTLCKSFGAGNKEVDSREFLKLQKDLLLDFTDDVKTSKRAAEVKRKNNCSENGKITYEPYRPDQLQKKFE